MKKKKVTAKFERIDRHGQREQALIDWGKWIDRYWSNVRGNRRSFAQKQTGNLIKNLTDHHNQSAYNDIIDGVYANLPEIARVIMVEQYTGELLPEEINAQRLGLDAERYKETLEMIRQKVDRELKRGI